MAQEQQYVQGQPVTVDVVFRLHGVAQDPALISAVVRSPSGAQVALVYPSANLVRVETGVYEVSLQAEEAGTYSIRLTGAGGVEAVGEAFVNVAASRVI